MDGDKNQLVTALSDLAADARIEFDWFDAAIVRHQLDGYVNEDYDDTK
ncbi:MAG: hypothetical protein MK095_03505 [Phycisphaerales bacterium]|nr:hypothetical protein [Phycisphaerales bacterium]